MLKMRQRLRKFLFPPDSGDWVGILRIGLGLQVTMYAWSLRADWKNFYATKGHGLVYRALAEAVLSGESLFTPRLGWLVAAGKVLGLTESTTVSLSWLALLTVGLCLLVGFRCRVAAIGAWFLYLCSAKSGNLFAYGVDNFTTLGLFYLMLAPLPDRSSLDWKLRARPAPDAMRLGFHRRVLQIHLCVIYFFGGISKSLGTDWWNGNSVWRALTRSPFDVVSADVLIRFAFILPAVGIVVCLLETGYPFFIWKRQTRPFWLSGILLMHISIGLTMGLYLFALIMIVLNAAAFGPEYLLAMQKRLRSRRKRTIIPQPS